MKVLPQDFRLGIIGGGQLGRMLMTPCTNFNLHTGVLDPSPKAPCHSLASEFHQGSLVDFDTVYKFGKQFDLLTIEIENINVDALKRLEAEGVNVYPQPSVIEIIQDKRLQKQFYRDQGIPTADFLLVDKREDIAAHADFLPAFNKLGKGGYDGGGVQRLDSVADLGKSFDAPGLLEKTIDFLTEISVITARNVDGEIAIYPAVECVFHPEYNLVDYLIAPAELPQEILDRAEDIARQTIESFGIVGLLAVEMFVTKEGEVLVNEVAPRPHNSGHQTISANLTSQYEQHLRAIMNLPLGDTSMHSPSAMVNLLGEQGHSGPACYEGVDELMKIPGANLVLYGKYETRPKRKMGHVTILDHDRNKLEAKVDAVKKACKVVTAR